MPSAPVSSNIAPSFDRVLGNTAYGAGVACSTSAPTALATALGVHPRRVAMGVARHSGVISFMAEQASQPYTLWCWSDYKAKLNAGDGWFKNGAVAAEYTKTVDTYAKASFTISYGEIFYIQAGTTNCATMIMGGSTPYNDSISKDQVFNA